MSLQSDRSALLALPRAPSFGRQPPRLASTPLEVLVVDDDDDAREFTGALVTRLGHRCRLAANGNDALGMIATSPVDVIVSDWDMPGMDGAELCRQTRS